jgi:hypothetical protein
VGVERNGEVLRTKPRGVREEKQHRTNSTEQTAPNKQHRADSRGEEGGGAGPDADAGHVEALGDRAGHGLHRGLLAEGRDVSS